MIFPNEISLEVLEVRLSRDFSHAPRGSHATTCFVTSICRCSTASVLKSQRGTALLLPRSRVSTQLLQHRSSRCAGSRGADLARPLHNNSRMSTSDSSGAPARSPHPKFIAGIYNYCDRWCERCRFQSRCRLYRDMRRMERVTDGLLDKADLEAPQSDGEVESGEEWSGAHA